MKRYKQVAAILAEAQTQIKAILTDPFDEHHSLKIRNTLQREMDYIALLTNTGDVAPETRERPGPATTIGGRPIYREQRVTKDDLHPQERQIETLRNKVEAAYATFLVRDSLDILKSYEDLVIRGVAKKAHMNITKDDPEKLTLKTINDIKEAIRNENDRQADIERQNPGVKIHTSGDSDLENILAGEEEIPIGTPTDTTTPETSTPATQKKKPAGK